MKSYKPATHSTAFGFAAFAMTALTITALVVAPAKMEPGDQSNGLVTTAKAALPMATEVTIEPGRIEVIAVREPTTASVLFRAAQAKPKQPV